MSGGAFDYIQHRMESVEDQLKELIGSYGAAPEECDGLSEDTFEKFKEGLMFLMSARIYIHNIDLLLSGDNSEQSFNRALEYDISDFIREMSKYE